MELERKIIHGKYSENIFSVAQRMLALAQKGYIVDTVFRDIPLTSENMNSIEDILEQKNRYEKEQETIYKNSPQFAIDMEIRRIYKV